MTGGNHQDGSQGGSIAGAASRVLPLRDDRESLSALLDGELPGDVARFTLKRLSHDVQWREACGRWQLIGDAMRGEPLALAPPDFAAGVARALGAYPGQVSQAAASTRPAATFARGRWIGGIALAASVAVAAVLVVRPFQSPAVEPQMPVASAPVSPAPSPAAAAAPITESPSVPAPASQVASGGERLASTRLPARARAARPAPVARETRSALPSHDIAIAAAAPVEGPFQPPGHDIVTRPWPRAVLPGSAAAGSFTVGFENAPPAQAFYPFEPQPSGAAAPEGEGSSPP